jgi:hypothetical protein
MKAMTRVGRGVKRCAVIAGLSLTLCAGVAVAQTQPPPRPPASDEFVPVNDYVWSLWRRLGKVEQELVQVTKPSAGRGR